MSKAGGGSLNFLTEKACELWELLKQSKHQQMLAIVGGRGRRLKLFVRPDVATEHRADPFDSNMWPK